MFICGFCVGRFHAFEIAHNMDRSSSGRGVRQFKTSLLQRLEQVKSQKDVHSITISAIICIVDV